MKIHLNNLVVANINNICFIKLLFIAYGIYFNINKIKYVLYSLCYKIQKK